MAIEKNPHAKNYPYTISGPWGGVIYTNEEGLRELQKEIKKMLDKPAPMCYNTNRK
jgi:hypothetical protein